MQLLMQSFRCLPLLLRMLERMILIKFIDNDYHYNTNKGFVQLFVSLCVNSFLRDLRLALSWQKVRRRGVLVYGCVNAAFVL